MRPERPRVAILGSRGIPGRYGGFEVFAEELSVRLARDGYDVTVFCPVNPSPMPTEYRGVKLEYVEERGIGPARSLLFDLACLWQARKRFDVVYMLGYGASPFCLIPRLFGQEVWINMDGIEWMRRKWSLPAKAWLRFTEWAACRVASRLIFDCRTAARYVCGRHLPSAPHSVLEYGAPLLEERPDPAILEEFGLESGRYFLVVARFEPENQILEIVRAHERSDCEMPLVVLTNTDRRSSYARTTLERRSDRVHFLGPIYDREVLAGLRGHCHAYVHGHTVGGTNPSLLEAMGCGNLTLAHDNAFNREVLRDHGLYFRGEEDLAELLLASEWLDAERRREYEEGSLDRASTHYDWERIVAGYRAVLDGAAELGDNEQNAPERKAA